jgi:hypothetical protein
VRLCHFCGARVVFLGGLWLRADVADINGYCPASPYDDLHHPED